MDFTELCTFESYRQHWSHYGYGGNFLDVIEQEFSRTKGNYASDNTPRQFPKNPTNTLAAWYVNDSERRFGELSARWRHTSNELRVKTI